MEGYLTKIRSAADAFEELQDLIIELVARHQVNTALYKEFEYEHIQEIGAQVADLVERTEDILENRLPSETSSVSQDVNLGTVDQGLMETF